MMSETMMTVRTEAYKRELYRKPQEQAYMLEALPARRSTLAWHYAMLLKLGDMLIATGTKLKNAAQPKPVLSQELL